MRLRRWIISVCWIGLVGCRHGGPAAQVGPAAPPAIPTSTSIPAIANMKLPQTTKGYFPNGMLAETVNADSFMNDWFSKNLRPMHEPELFSEKMSGREVYRVLWLRHGDGRLLCALSTAHTEAMSVWSKC